MSRAFSHICVVWNPIAGNRRCDVEVLATRFSHSDCRLDVVRTSAPRHATELARAAVARGADLVLAAGGDGTANEVGSALLGSETALGLLPLGSGNALANALGVPTDPQAACRVVIDAAVRPIDVGVVGERIFLSTMGIGIDAEVCRRYASRSGRRRGFIPYLALGARALLSYEPLAVDISIDGGTAFGACPLIATVANTAQFGNGAVIAPAALPDDGLLDLCLIEDAATIGRLMTARHLFTGTIDRAPGVRMVRARTIRFERSGPIQMQLDGEAATGQDALEIGLSPQAIRVAVPATGLPDDALSG